METEIARIKQQINQTRKMSPQPAQGYGSEDWLARAECALRRYQIDIQRIQLVMMERSNTDSQPGAALANAFIAVSRRRLDKIVFDAIMEEAMEEKS